MSEEGPAGPAGTPRRLPVLAFASQAAWREWLEAQHASSKGLWLKIAKKGSGAETVSYAEALDVALCYGWIDGQKDAVDDRWWLQRFTPRGPRSRWSKTNRARATALIEAGQMHPAGLWEWSGHEPTAGGRRPTTRPRGPRPPRTWPSMPTPTPGILRHAGPHQPLRHPVPDPRRQTARDPGSAPQDVRCHARSGREALSLTPRSPAVRTGQAPAGAAAPRRRRWRRDG